jgi:3-hydroxyacyl-CoA dehydrogenase
VSATAAPTLRVAVLGAGTMAPGIAAAFAGAGHDVRLWARRGERAAEAVERAAEMARFLADQDLTVASGAADRRLAPAHDLGELVSADVVVEAVAEQLAAKR